MIAPIFPKPWLGIQKSAGRTSLVVQLRMPHYQCRDLGNAVLIRGGGTKIPHSVWPKKKKKSLKKKSRSLLQWRTEEGYMTGFSCNLSPVFYALTLIPARTRTQGESRTEKASLDWCWVIWCRPSGLGDSSKLHSFIMNFSFIYLKNKSPMCLMPLCTHYLLYLS